MRDKPTEPSLAIVSPQAQAALNKRWSRDLHVFATREGYFVSRFVRAGEFDAVFPRPLTRWQRLRFKVEALRERVTDAWAVLLGRKNACDGHDC